MRYERIGFREEKSLNDKINDNDNRRKKEFNRNYFYWVLKVSGLYKKP